MSDSDDDPPFKSSAQMKAENDACTAAAIELWLESRKVFAKPKDIKYSDLTAYHQAKIFRLAREWRLVNHAAIKAMIAKASEQSRICLEVLNPIEPAGVKAFDFKRWTAENWLWFSDLLTKRALR